MTNEERDKVIRILQWLHDNKFLFRSTEEDVKYATKLAIQELEQEPCDDAISRQVVLRMQYKIDDSATLSTRNVVNVDDIEDLPSVKPQEPKTGHWIMPVNDDGMSDIIYYQVRCSKCGFDLDPQTWDMELHQYDADKYCPKCGAMMVEEQERSE